MTTPVVETPAAADPQAAGGPEGAAAVTFPVLVVEGLATDDRRLIDPGALTHRALPIPLLAMRGKPHGGEPVTDAEIVGRIDTLTRIPGPQVTNRDTGKPFPAGSFVWSGSGWLSQDTAAYAMVRDRYLTGVSVDLTSVDATVADDPDAEVWVQTHAAAIAAATLVPVAAFSAAFVEIDGETLVPSAEALTAAAVPSWRSADLGEPCGLCAAGLVAAGEERTGAIVSLVPSEADATRLAVEGGEPATELHLTLADLGEAADWSEDQRGALRNALEKLASWDTVTAEAWATASFNPDGGPGGDRTPCAVYLVSADALPALRDQVMLAVDQTDTPLPEQHPVFTPHISVTYQATDTAPLTEVGPLTLDRIRVAFADDITDIPLRGAETVPEAEPTQEPADVEAEPLVAAGAPVRPPAEWFQDPQLEEATPLTVTADGRVFGHAAAWGVCHLSFQNSCVMAPRSPSGYAYFTTGVVTTDDGQDVPVGHLTMGTGHAAEHLAARPAAVHYDDTGSVMADVAVGEDRHGIWFAGALRPDADELRVHRFRASPLSGDWRPIGNALELVAVLSVNTPGFVIPRARARVASGQVTSLVAAGVVAPEAPRPAGAPGIDYDALAEALAHRLEVRQKAATYAAEHSTLLAALDVAEHERLVEELAVSSMPPQLRLSYLKGEVAARIAWGTPGDWRRCVAQAKKHGMGAKAEGACSELHNDAVGFYPGDKRNQ